MDELCSRLAPVVDPVKAEPLVKGTYISSVPLDKHQLQATLDRLYRDDPSLQLCEAIQALFQS